MSTSESLQCIVCGNPSVLKVSGIVSAETSTSVSKSHTAGRSGFYATSARTNTTVRTSSQLAALLTFQPPEKELPGCIQSLSLFPNARTKAIRAGNAVRLQESRDLWNSMWYCPKCDNCFNPSFKLYAAPQVSGALYRLPVPPPEPKKFIAPTPLPPGPAIMPTTAPPSPTLTGTSVAIHGVPVIHRAWFVYLTQFTCFPIGLIFVWLQPNWSKTKKWIITGIELLILLIMVGHR